MIKIIPYKNKKGYYGIRSDGDDISVYTKDDDKWEWSSDEFTIDDAMKEIRLKNK